MTSMTASSPQTIIRRHQQRHTAQSRLCLLAHLFCFERPVNSLRVSGRVPIAAYPLLNPLFVVLFLLLVSGRTTNVEACVHDRPQKRHQGLRSKLSNIHSREKNMLQNKERRTTGISSAVGCFLFILTTATTVFFAASCLSRRPSAVNASAGSGAFMRFHLGDCTRALNRNTSYRKWTKAPVPDK